MNYEPVNIGTYRMTPEGVVEPCSSEEADELSKDEEASYNRLLQVSRWRYHINCLCPVCLMNADGTPQYFETVHVTPEPNSIVLERYSTYLEAMAGHDKYVAEMIEGSPLNQLRAFPSATVCSSPWHDATFRISRRSLTLENSQEPVNL